MVRRGRPRRGEKRKKLTPAEKTRRHTLYARKWRAKQYAKGLVLRKVGGHWKYVPE